MVSTEGRIEKRKLVCVGALVTRGHLLGEVWGEKCFTQQITAAVLVPRVSTQGHAAWACCPGAHSKWRQQQTLVQLWQLWCSVVSPWQQKHRGLWEAWRAASIPLGHPKDLRRRLRVRSSLDEQGWQNILGTESSMWFTDMCKELHMDLIYMSGVKGVREEVIREGLKLVSKSWSWGFPTGL